MLELGMMIMIPLSVFYSDMGMNVDDLYPRLILMCKS